MSVEFGPGCPWYGMFEKFGAPNVNWCEPTICALINEPANAWSNLSYIIIAIFILTDGIKDPVRGKQRLMFSISLAFVGIGSFIYHATNNAATQLLDFIGMFFHLCLPMAINLIRLKKFKREKLVPLYSGLFAIFMVMYFVLYMISAPVQITIGVVFFFILITEGMLKKKETIKKNYKLFGLGLFFILFGWVFSFLDISRNWCVPDNIFLHGHAIWHILSALSLYFIYLFYDRMEME